MPVRALVSALALVPSLLACDGPPPPREELARFCDAAEAVRGEAPETRASMLMQRFGETTSPPMQDFIARLADVPADEKWAYTYRFAAQHGEQNWRCPALEEIFDEGAAPSE